MSKNHISDYLNTHQIPFEIFTHEAVFTAKGAEERFREMDIPSNKNLVLRNKKKTKFWMFTVRGDTQTDLKAISDLVGERVSFAKPEHLDQHLRTFPGACSPFGLLFDQSNHVDFWIEDALSQSPLLGFHPNDNTQTWRMENLDFKRFIESLDRPWQIAKF